MRGVVAPDRPTRAVAPAGAWWTLAVLFALYLLSFIDRYTLSMVMPSIKRDLALSDVEVGLVLGPAFSVCYAVCGLPLGWLADRYSRRWIIFLGAVAFGCATVGTGLAGSFLALFLARACVGVGEAAVSPAAYALLGERFPRSLQTTVSSIYNMAAKLGSSGAYLLGGAGLALAAVLHRDHPGLREIAGWRLVLLATGAPAILCASLVFTFREHRGEGKGQAPRQSLIRFLVENRRLMGPMLLGFTLMGACGNTITGWAPAFVARTFSLSPLHYGSMLSLTSLAAALTLVLKGGVVDWLYVRGVKDAHLRVYTWVLLAAMPAAAVMYFVRDPVLFMVLYGLVAVAAVPIFIFISATVALVSPPEVRGQVIAVFLFCTSAIGGGIGPAVVGALTDYVFKDEMKVGNSLFVLVAVCMPVAYLCLRAALPSLRAAIAAREAGEPVA